jgi:adenylate cyclase
VRAFKLILDGGKLGPDSIGSDVALQSDAGDLTSLSDGEADAAAPDPQAVEIEFWDSIKNSKLASEYEAYLGQYPEGSFAALARVRLQAIAEDAAAMRDPKDREIELSFWKSVRASDNTALIRAYLEKYPEGEFSTLAELRIAELEGGSAK